MKTNNLEMSFLHRIRGGDFFVKGKNQAAYKELKKSLKYNPKNYEAIILTGDIESEIGTLKKSLKFYDRAISLDPKNPDAYESKANTLLGEGHPLMALPVAKFALRLRLKQKAKKKQLELLYDILISALFEAGKLKEGFLLLRKMHKKIKSLLIKSLFKRYQKQIREVEGVR